jgi:glycosyltransferase involved in cell wall biosynthesis
MARCLHGTKYEFAFVCTGDHKGMRASELEELGCEIFLWNPSVRNVVTGAGLRRIFRQGQWDIVHSHPFNLSGWILAHASKENIHVRISHFHNTHSGRPPGITTGIRHLIGRHLVSRFATHQLACSKVALDYAPQIRNSKGRKVLSYGVDVKGFSSAPRGKLRAELHLSEDTPLFGHIGRFYEQKNHSGLMRIFNRISEQIRTAHLVLCGDGPLRPTLETTVARLGLGSRVHFLGQRLDVQQLVGDFDLFLFPSLFEGLGIVLVEAVCAGVPVVASRISACQEALSGTVGTNLVPASEEAAFAAAAVNLIGAKHQQSPQWLNRWNRRFSASQLESFYEATAT